MIHHMCKAVKWVMFRPESNTFTPVIQWVPSRKKKVRGKIFSLKRLNNQNTTDHVSIIRATGKLHAMPNSGKKVYILSS